MASPLRSFVVFFALLVGLGAAHEDKKGHKHFHCDKEGRFPDPRDCGGFIDCIPDGEGGLVDRSGTCRGRAYDPSVKSCVELQEAQGCKPRNARALTSDPKLAFVCEGAPREFVCADCKTLVNCINGTAYPESCGYGDLCAFKPSDFGGGVCYPAEPEECVCDKPNVFKSDLYDPSRFFFCDKEAADPLIYQCPEDHFFDPRLSQCKSYDGLPECEKIGVFADPGNCTTYYTCIFTKTGWVQKPFSCNNETHVNLMYNDGTGVCEDPCDWDTGEFTCVVEGRFPDPLDCQRYYECIADPSFDGGFRQILHECPDEYVWDPSARNDYGHCVLAGTSKEACVPHRPEKCIIPENQCISN